MFALADGPGWGGMLQHVLGAIWEKDGPESGKLAGPVGFCGDFYREWEIVRDLHAVCSSSAPGTRVASLRRMGWDAWTARCKGNASGMRAGSPSHSSGGMGLWESCLLGGSER
jgi:hypothetical protein